MPFGKISRPASVAPWLVNVVSVTSNLMRRPSTRSKLIRPALHAERRTDLPSGRPVQPYELVHRLRPFSFNAPVVPRFSVFPYVLAGSVGVALISAILPIGLLRRLQPAIILKGE